MDKLVYRFIGGRTSQQVAYGYADLYPDSGGLALHHIEQRLENCCMDVHVCEESLV